MTVSDLIAEHGHFLGFDTVRDARMAEFMRCRCIWHGVACAKQATQEDGLCDWCGPRTDEQMRGNPYAVFGSEGEYLGLGGGSGTGYNHLECRCQGALFG